MTRVSQNWSEKQLTNGNKGHFLNPVQAWSADDNWIFFDARNNDSQIGRTGQIERVHVPTGKVELIYETKNQTLYGPGVGAVTSSPTGNKLVFIHGLQNCNKNHPYSIIRRSGIGIFPDNKTRHPVHYDGRDVIEPYTKGTLRGGSHAHSWSGDGKWISFTYNDAIMAQLALKDALAQDLRMVGVMAPWGEINVEGGNPAENFSGKMFAMVITRVTERPHPGSDEISKAYEDGWIGRDGYIDKSGKKHSRAVAFLGDVRDMDGNTVTEVFVVDLPESKPDLTTESQLAGTSISRPQPLSNVKQRRLTYTKDWKYPGVQGPRQWMKSSQDGSLLYFMMKDDNGLVQIYSVPTVGGTIEQMTDNDFSIETSFDINPASDKIAFGAGQKLYITNMYTGDTECLTPIVKENYSDLRAIQWSNSGNYLTYNRQVADKDTSWFQIFTLSVNE